MAGFKEVFIKKALRVLGIIVVAAATALAFAACDGSANGTVTGQVRIRVTGIPDNYTGYGVLGLVNNAGTRVAVSEPTPIGGGSAEMALLAAGTDRPFATAGTFGLEFAISGTPGGEADWFGDTAGRVAGGVTTVPFGDFTPREDDLPVVDGYRVVPGDSLEAQLDWLHRNARSGSPYLIAVDDGVSSAPRELSFFGRSGIEVVLRGNGLIDLSANGSLFTVDNGVILTLDGVTLRGRDHNDAPLVHVLSDGKLLIKDGTITGNRSSSWGAGVLVDTGASLVMEGGAIFGNSATATDNSPIGAGGVDVRSGATFTMRGGEISGNQTSGEVWTESGGVRIYNATFIMEGGRIYGNSATSSTAWASAGGVRVFSNGTFTMHGGEISGNTVSSLSDGDPTGNSGGVCVYNAAFIMKGGTISGNHADGGGGGVRVSNDGTFTMYDGEISGNETSGGGGGVYAATGGTFTMRGGTISGNTANLGGGVEVVACWGDGRGTFIMRGGAIAGNTANLGGGVEVSIWGAENTGIFLISDGVIYGSDYTDAALRNTARIANAPAALRGTAQRGTFNNDVFTPALGGTLGSTSNTIRVVNGQLQ